MDTDLVYRLRKRALIRRQIPSRKSVQENKPDRLADLLDEAAKEIELLHWIVATVMNIPKMSDQQLATLKASAQKVLDNKQ